MRSTARRNVRWGLERPTMWWNTRGVGRAVLSIITLLARLPLLLVPLPLRLILHQRALLPLLLHFPVHRQLRRATGVTQVVPAQAQV